jgi:hypothetical protein
MSLVGIDDLMDASVKERGFVGINKPFRRVGKGAGLRRQTNGASLISMIRGHTSAKERVFVGIDKSFRRVGDGLKNVTVQV